MSWMDPRGQSPACLAFRTFVFLIIDMVVGIGLFYFCGFKGKKTTPLADSFYFSSTTTTTTGYGDVIPASVTSKILTSVYIMFSAFIVNYFVSPPFSRFVQSLEGRDMSRQRRIVYSVMHSLGCIVLGIALFFCEMIGLGNTPYAAIVSFSSTGLGDFAFSSVWGRVIGSVWLLICHLVNYRLGCLVFEEGDESFVQNERDAVRDESLQEAQNSAKEGNDARVKAENARAKAEKDAREADDARAKAEEKAREADDARAKAEEKAREADDARAKAEKDAREADDARAKAEENAREADDARAKAEEKARAAQDLVSEKTKQNCYLEKEKAEMMKELEDLRSQLRC